MPHASMKLIVTVYVFETLMILIQVFGTHMKNMSILIFFVVKSLITHLEHFLNVRRQTRDRWHNFVKIFAGTYHCIFYW
jgi:hypothetical protein